MSWWRFIAPRDEDEIAEYVAAEIAAGRITPEWGPFLEKALRDEQAGKCTIMRKPKIERRLPRGPGQQQQCWNGFWWHR
jgi:hypothetical protein